MLLLLMAVGFAALAFRHFANENAWKRIAGGMLAALGLAIAWDHLGSGPGSHTQAAQAVTSLGILLFMLYGMFMHFFKL